MKCATCGTEAREGIRFCESCGADFSVAPTTTERPQEPVPVASPAVAAPVMPAVASPAPTVVVRQPAAAGYAAAAWSQAVFIGAILIAGSALLPWIATPGFSSSGFDVPFALIYDQSAAIDGIPLGPFILGLGLVAIGLSFVVGLDWLQRLAGLLAFGAAGAVAVQFARALAANGLGGEIFSFLSLGVYIALLGGALVAFASR